MTQKDLSFEEVVKELGNTLFKVKGLPSEQDAYKWIEWNAWVPTILARTYSFEIVALAGLEVLVQLDEKGRLAALKERERGQPGKILLSLLQEASQKRPKLLLAEMLKRLERISVKNIIFFKVLEDTASFLDSLELAQALRKAHRASNPIMEPLFHIITLKASCEALPVLERLQKDIKYDRAWSAEADRRKTFAKKHQKELGVLIETLRKEYSVDSLFGRQLSLKTPV